jgi:L-alanine-DL-glutamate epimerase-like enolase superfamily enzyme
MRIERIELSQLSLPLTVPYRVSSRTYEAFTPIVVRVFSEHAEAGFGEAFLTPGYTSETVEGGWAFCAEHARRAVGLDSADLRHLVLADIGRSPGAASAMLSALDVLERDPLLEVATDARVPLLAPVHSTDLAKIADEVEALLADGFRTLKVKVGFEVDVDLRRLERIQTCAAGRATLRLDANRGFSREQGCAFAQRLDPAGIELFEQPCASADWESNAAVARVSRVPVMLDESIYGEPDIDRAATIEGVGFVKLKLKKIGSVSMLARALQRIRQLGMEPVLGDGVSTEIACWMEACVARSTIRNAGEMNGYLKPTRRLFQDALRFEAGAVVLPAGWRARLDDAAVRAHTTRSECFGVVSTAARAR